MTVKEILSLNGINDSVLHGSDINDAANILLQDVHIPHGYDFRMHECLPNPYGARALVVDILPKVKWTDGTFRSVTCGGWECEKYNVRLLLET